MGVGIKKEENALLEQAICFVLQKHAGQCRKGGQLPYIVHPLEVMQQLLDMEADTNLLIAGLLHDTVEDTDTTLEELADVFNADVAHLVGEHSEDKSRSWEERKLTSLQDVAQVDKREQMLVLADMLSNIRDMERDYKRVGEQLWQCFNRPRTQQAWYYHAAIPALQALADYPDTKEAYGNFVQLVEAVFGGVADIPLAEEELTDRLVTLYQDEERGLYWQVEQGRLTISGEDYDAEDSYECNLSLAEADMRSFFQSLHRAYGAVPVDELVQQHFGEEDGFYKLKAFLDKHQLVYEFFSF